MQKRIATTTILAIFILAAFGAAQETAAQQLAPEVRGVPVLTGYGGFVSTFRPGSQELEPTVAPILLVPFGDRWLIEAEEEIEGSYAHMTGQPWEHEWEKGLEYAQIDFMANKHLTVVAGRFLTPFGIFNERLHPSWIKNIQAMPLIMPIGTGSGNGGMLRGGVSLARSVNLNYAAYFSAASTITQLDATRAAGTRISLFFPGQRVEIGASFQRTLQDKHFNSYGGDLIWQLKPIPLDIRGEYARGRLLGSGYWIEGAYRLRRVPFARPFFRKSQAVFRMEQYFAPAMMPAMASGMELPEVNTQRPLFGWNYYFNDSLKLSFSAGREFSSMGNQNVFSMGIAYRWAFPLAGGRAK